eukprot:m.40350 g.40350  ORF g.40350 m.40350 type:complete len:557 (-) comp11359_c0_seq2:1363-3033(-)
MAAASSNGDSKRGTKRGNPSDGEGTTSDDEYPLLLDKRMSLGPLNPARDHSHHEKKFKEACLGLSSAPTREQLERFVSSVHPNELPVKYRRSTNRIFANREVNLSKIKYYGFDMDYTLAAYNSPEFEELAYSLAVERLVESGYPEDLKKLKYDQSFPLRGLLVDRQRGNLLKIDAFGNILVSFHGRQQHSPSERKILFPSGVIAPDQIGSKFKVLDTLFALPQACLFADVIHHLEACATDSLHPCETADSTVISYSSVYQDLREAFDKVHDSGELKSKTVADLPRYCVKDERLKLLLERLRDNGKFVFLLTNSGWEYTNNVMTYLLGEDWRFMFDFVTVAAKKPLFFSDGTRIRRVNVETGRPSIIEVNPSSTKLEPGMVFQGGNLATFHKLTGAVGSDVLYVGDHIYADILVAKKARNWRVMLIVPELAAERKTTESSNDIQKQLASLEWVRAELFRDLDSKATVAPDTSVLTQFVRELRHQYDQSFPSQFGSLFRSGTRLSYFAWQTQRFADIYSHDALCLLNYPAFYRFCPEAPPLMPHEEKFGELHSAAAVM